MSTIDLIILGILLDKPMNAYELDRYINEKQIGRFLKISTPSIYKSCKRLFKSGFLDGKTTKESELPEKTIYQINKKGEKEFYNLMKYFSSDIKPFFIDFNVFLWNIEKIEKKQGIKMLMNLHDELLNLKKWIVQHEKEESNNLSFAGKAIVKQYRMTTSTLLNWSEEIIRDYKQIKGNKND